MPEPRSPVIVGLEEREQVIAKNQPEYLPLPVLLKEDDRGQRVVMSRWELSEVDRDKMSAGADVYVEIMLLGNFLSPLKVTVMHASRAREEAEKEGY